MKIALFDYGMGNIHSLAKAIEGGGGRIIVEPDPSSLLDADAMVLPGGGSFAAAAQRLAPGAHAIRIALSAGFPCLAIGLGMQLLFESSEDGVGVGLALMPGHSRRLQSGRLPHIGWDSVDFGDDPLFRGLDSLVAYYATTFVVEPGDSSAIIAWTSGEGGRFPAAVRQGNTWGVQFQPEKSGPPGRRVIHNFIEAAAAAIVDSHARSVRSII